MNILTTLAQTLDVDVPQLDPKEVLLNGLNIFYFAAGATAVIVIIIAGFYFVTSGSDSGTLTKARNIIVYTAIGLVAVLGAFVVTQFILGGLR